MASVPSERLIEHALALVVQSEVAPGEAASSAQEALAVWSGKSPEHDAATREARRRWGTLGAMAADLRTHFQQPVVQADTAARAGRDRQRRTLLLSIAALLGTGTLAARGIHWYRQQPLFAASYSTQTAQMRKITLADGIGGSSGSRLDMAPRSAIEVTLYRQRRSVAMAGGEVRFDVAPDASRPFEVLTRAARIEVVGTVFTVRDRGGPVVIGVERGQVRVHVLPARAQDAGHAEHQVVDLGPGQALDIRDGRPEAVHQVDTAALSSWREGWLVFENVPLGEALATINAYRASPIEEADPRIRALRLTGRFRASDSAGLVAALPAILPLATRTRPDGSIELRMR